VRSTWKSTFHILPSRRARLLPSSSSSFQNTPDVARFHRPRVSTPTVPFPWDQVSGIYVTSHAERKMVLPCVQSDTALDNNCGILVPATAFAHGAQTKMARI
jgi:hypothetical protein